MGLHYSIRITRVEDGHYEATVRQLPEFTMEGTSPDYLEMEVEEAIRMYFMLSGRPTSGLDFSVTFG